MTQTDELGTNIGAALRRIRKASGMTLEAAAGQAELTKGYLSKVESGQATPSTRVMVRLADVFGVPLSDILMSDAERRPISVVRADERKVITKNGSDIGHTYELASRAKLHPRAEVFFLTLSVLEDETPPRFKHSGEEIILVLEGRMRFQYGGMEIIVGPGDCIQFDASIEHYGLAEGAVPARLFVVNIPDRFEDKASKTRKR